MFDLRAFRDEQLQMSQQKLALLMNVRQDFISRLEQRPEDMTLDFLLRLCDLTGMTPNELLNFSFPKPEPVHLTNPYLSIKARCAKLREYLAEPTSQIETALQVEPDNAILQQAVLVLQQLDSLVKNISTIPVVVVLGNSNAGKSRLINSLVGVDILPSSIVPTYPLTVYLKHRDQQPDWMQEPVWVFRSAASDEPPFDVRQCHDEIYCRSRKLTAGGFHILRDLPFVAGQGAAEAAVLFVDSPILQLCDMVEAPPLNGLRAEQSREAELALHLADAAVYLSPSETPEPASTATVIQELVTRLPQLEAIRPDMPALGNLLIVASKAEMLKHSEICAVLDNKAHMFSQLSKDALLTRSESVGRKVDVDTIKGRIYTYSVGPDAPHLRANFELALRTLLEVYLPRPRLTAAEAAIETFKAEARSGFDNLAEELRARSAAQQALLHGSRAEIVNRMDKRLLEVASELKRQDQVSFRTWYLDHTTPGNIERLIAVKAVTKSTAHHDVLRYLSHACTKKAEQILRASTTEFHAQLSEYLQAVERLTGDVGGTSAFRLQGVLLNGLKTTPSRGAFDVPSLHHSILKNAPVIWGTAAGTVGAAAVLGALGSTMGLLVGVGLGAVAAAKWLTGPKWESTLARRLADLLMQSDVQHQYLKLIARYWEDTERASRQTIELLRAEVEVMAQVATNRANADERTLIGEVERAGRLRDFFGGLPWGAGI